MRAPFALQIGILLFVALILQSCSGPSFKRVQVPENGYDQTLNYQFQAQVYADSDGECQRITIRVKAINKVYWKTPPPDRLQLFDDDCNRPVRFERVQYLGDRGEGLRRLSGIEVSYFWSEQYRLQDELISWLWEEGII